MKNTTKAKIGGVFAGIMVLATSCPSSTPCTCSPIDHLGVGESCCGGDTCNCTVKVYGQVTDNDGKVINIYRQGAADADATIVTVDIISAYNGLSALDKANIKGKIDEIRILPADAAGVLGYSYRNEGGKYILSLDFRINDIYADSVFSGIANGTITPST